MTRIVVALIALLVILPAAAPALPADTAATAIDVKGAKCEMCVEKITGAVLELKGVYSATVDLKAKVASVKYDPEAVTVAKLEKAIASVGYDANRVKKDKKAYSKLSPCCK